MNNKKQIIYTYKSKRAAEKVRKIKNQRKVGFDTSFNANEAEYEKIKDIVLEELKVAFKPEFLNRVDDIIVFNQLKEEDTLKIVNLMLNDTISRLKEKNIDLIYEEDLNKFLINKNKNLEFGARPLRRTIQNLVEDSMAEEILDGKLDKGKLTKDSIRRAYEANYSMKVCTQKYYEAYQNHSLLDR